jgi:uncharacterized protein YacL
LKLIIRLVFALLGGLAAAQVAEQAGMTHRFGEAGTWARWVGVIVGGAAAGWLVAFFLGGIAIVGIRRIEAAAQRRSAGELVVGGVGLLLGLGVGALATLAIGALPYVGNYLLLPLFLVLGYVFARVAARQHRQILRLVGLGGEAAAEVRPATPAGATPKRRATDRQEPTGLLVDTSAIIDGRIADVMATGFIDRELVIPVFVLLELQRVADSTDTRKRARGRRGLEVMHDLRLSELAISTPDIDYPQIEGVDTKLCRLASERGLPILTTDYNLNRVAGIQGLTVLNINDLANALKPAVLPGESLRVKVLREGKESEQGVGYLDDGTMIVIEGGRQRVGDTVDVEVTSVLQSASGKMIFSRVA